MNPNPFLTQNRRSFLQKSGFGLGSAALASMINQDAAAADDDPLVKLGLHHAPKAKRVIYIHMVGAPSHLDLFDFKPELQKRTGELCPDEFFDLNQLAFIREQPNLLGTPKDER
ncbi:MAG TPA: sulfatase, partial [Verrucomicrobiales bacterium]|nr:sulfatase [Verrucomicrobiales bacterium]